MWWTELLIELYMNTLIYIDIYIDWFIIIG